MDLEVKTAFKMLAAKAIGTTFAAMLITACVGTQAKAALLSLDWQTAGDNKITRDDNGKEWLDATETLGMSSNAVLAELGSGGMFEGFRFATGNEVAGLWASAGWNGDNFWGPTNSSNNGVVATLASFLGQAGNAPGIQGEDGVRLAHTGTSTDPIVVSVAIDFGDRFAPFTTADFFSLNNNGFDPNTGGNFAMGLVRADVPLPAGVFLLITAMTGLGYITRRRTA